MTISPSEAHIRVEEGIAMIANLKRMTAKSLALDHAKFARTPSRWRWIHPAIDEAVQDIIEGRRKQ